MTSRPHSVKRFTCTNKTQNIYPWLPSVEIILWFHQYIYDMYLMKTTLADYVVEVVQYILSSLKCWQYLILNMLY